MSARLAVLARFTMLSRLIPSFLIQFSVCLCKRVDWPAAEISDAQTAKLQASHPTFSYKQGDVTRKYGMSRTARLTAIAYLK